MINFRTYKKLQLILKNPKSIIQERITQLFDAALLIYEREYKIQVPVDKGTTRRNVMSSSKGSWSQNTLKGVIKTEAWNKGRNYPIFVHEGTGRFKGVPVDYGATHPKSKRGVPLGRKRSGMTGSGGIRPNKFVNRTYTQATPLVIKFFNNNLHKIIND